MPHSTLPICEANSGCSKSEDTTGRTIYIINTISVAIFSSNATGRVEFLDIYSSQLYKYQWML
jgi:hypothetical protein